LLTSLVVAHLLLAAAPQPLVGPGGLLPHGISPHPRLAEPLRRTLNLRLLGGRDAKPARLDTVVSVDVRFARPLSDDEMVGVEARGARFVRLGGKVAHVGAVYGVRVSMDRLGSLLDHPLVRSVFSLPPTVRPEAPGNPFGASHAWTRLERLWPHRGADGQRTTGSGTVICDIDSAADLFHPLFFRADGGLYAWLDVDSDGVFTPGEDAVDLDGDGVAVSSELLLRLGGAVVDPWGGDPVDVPGFQAARHWLYADTNGNQARDFGPARGFTEQDPAYGEPLFVVDDVDEDGVLEVGDKLLRLRSSRFKAILRPATGLVYQRGTNLVDVPLNTDPGHGTGVAGILVGGVPGLRWLYGLASDADLILVVHDAAEGETGLDPTQYMASMTSTLSWAEDQGARVVLHEYGTAIGEFADGSSDWEQVLDALSTRGIVQATAAHNFAGNRGRARLTLQPAEQRTLRFRVDDLSSWGYTLYVLMGTVRWRGAEADLAASLELPDGTVLDATQEVFQDHRVMFGARSVSSRGTGMVSFQHFLYQHPDYLPLAGGRYSLTLRNDALVPREVFLYLSDETMYAMAVTLEMESDDRSSMAWPSTADSAIAVAAFHVNQAEGSGRLGDLASYSGRGPRIDLAKTISVGAPADHYTAQPGSRDSGWGNLQVFGGTSGALPHVAASLALLLQQEPTLTPAQLKSRVEQSAASDTQTGAVPNDAWGGGRLAVDRLLLGADLPARNAPRLRVDLPETIYVPLGGSAPITLDVSRTLDDVDPLSALTFRWDADYDGTPDGEATGQAGAVTLTLGSPRQVVVEVENTRGFTSRTRVVLVGVEEPPDAGVPDASSASSDPKGPAGCPSCPQGGAAWGVVVLLGLVLRGRRLAR
jgi:subtilisin family serine protease